MEKRKNYAWDRDSGCLIGRSWDKGFFVILWIFFNFGIFLCNFNNRNFKQLDIFYNMWTEIVKNG